MKPNLKMAFNLSFSQPTANEDFNVSLFRLFRKADKYNKEKLALSFPAHNKIYLSWKVFGVTYGPNDVIVAEEQKIR